MKLFTARLGKVRGDPDMLDTTIKSAFTNQRHILAPTWELVGGSKKYQTMSRF